ncbi:MAG: hypothetical protein M3441_28755 [Chloroflexota bacterium]|nr:hypothetical protein [Chloroflexota bacterium]
MAAVLFWLFKADLVPEELGWQGIVDTALIWVLLLAALVLALSRSTDAHRIDRAVTLAVLALALVLAFADPETWSAATAFPRRELMGITAFGLLVYAPWRLRRKKWRRRSVSEPGDPIPLEVVGAVLVFTFEAGVASWLSWRPALYQAVLLGLAIFVAFTAFQPNSKYQSRIAKLGRKYRKAAGLLTTAGFIVMPALLALAIEGARSPKSTAVSMLLANALTVLVLFGLVSFGMDHVGDWMLREFWQQLWWTIAYFWSIGASVLLAVAFFTFFTTSCGR